MAKYEEMVNDAFNMHDVYVASVITTTLRGHEYEGSCQSE